MKLGNILRSLCFASGVAVGTAIALSKHSRRRRPAPVGPPQTPAHVRRDYFSITRARGTSEKWILQGFGRCECLLTFNSWREAMDQASFRLENLTQPELISIATR